MTVTTWVATSTGLPSIYSDTPVRVVAADGRLLADGTTPVLLSDALAAPGVPATYTVGSSTVTLTRRDDGHMLTDLAGRGRVQLAWLGDDEDEYDLRVAFHETSARRSPVVRYALRPAAPRGTLKVRTMADATLALRSLVEARGYMVAVHSPAACDIADCDVEPVRVVVFSGASSARSARVDHAVREWDLPYRGVDARELTRLRSGCAPVVTWGEWMEYRASSGDRADYSYVELASLIAGMPS